MTEEGTAFQPNGTAKKALKIPAQKILLWIGLVSIVMLFAGLTSAYIVTQADNLWVRSSLPKMFMVSTAFILISSFTMKWAVSSIKKDNYKNGKTALLI